MKTAVAIVISFCLALALGWFIWGRPTAVPALAIAPHPVEATPSSSQSPRPLPPASNLPLPSEWQELRSVREKTLQQNPELAAEYKSLMAELDQQQRDLDAAMIKIDPRVAPVIAKLAEIRKQNSVSRSASTPN